MSDYKERELSAAQVENLRKRLIAIAVKVPEAYENRSYLAGYLAGKDEAVKLLEVVARALEVSDRATTFGGFTIPNGYIASYESDRAVVSTPGGTSLEIPHGDLEGVVKALFWAYDLHRSYA